MIEHFELLNIAFFDPMNEIDKKAHTYTFAHYDETDLYNLKGHYNYNAIIKDSIKKWTKVKLHTLNHES